MGDDEVGVDAGRLFVVGQGGFEVAAIPERDGPADQSEGVVRVGLDRLGVLSEGLGESSPRVMEPGQPEMRLAEFGSVRRALAYSPLGRRVVALLPQRVGSIEEVSGVGAAGLWPLGR